MTIPMSEAKLAEIEARHRAQTPGPHRWEGMISGQDLRLMAHTQPWRPIVMDFARWGMNRAQPRFRDETHSIGIMAPAKNFIVPVAEHRPEEVGYIDHPDAIGLAASWQDKDDLLAEVRRLQSESAAMKDRRCETCGRWASLAHLLHLRGKGECVRISGDDGESVHLYGLPRYMAADHPGCSHWSARQTTKDGETP